jgi:hypothetical protein
MSNWNLPPGVSTSDEHINPSDDTLTRVRRIRSHTGHARFIAECDEHEVGEIERREDIPSPYAYSPKWPVYRHPKWGNVVIRETSHRCFDVFQVPKHLIL